jgi:hypothetical protein
MKGYLYLSIIFKFLYELNEIIFKKVRCTITTVLYKLSNALDK